MWYHLSKFATWLSNLCWAKMHRDRNKKWIKGYKDWRRKHD